MNARRAATVATVGLVVAGAFAPATAAPKKKPITQTYQLTLLPVQGDPTAACATPQLEGISVDTKKIAPTGPGQIAVKVTGYYGDWDISIKDGNGDELTKGSGNDTPNAGAGEETAELKLKKPEPLQIAICNFAGTPQATATFTYTYR